MTANSKEQILAPDKVLINTLYTFTMNPNDDYQYWKEDESQRISKSLRHIKFILRKYIYINLDLIIDVSRTGRIHWHGTVNFKHENCIKRFFMEAIHELLTKFHIEMDTIADIDKWTAYCKKTLHFWNISVNTNDFLRIHNIGGTEEIRVQKDFLEYLEEDTKLEKVYKKDKTSLNN